MKKSFMTRALATGLSLAMAFSLSAATNVTTAAAAAKPAMKSSKMTIKVGQSKNYQATAATQKSYKISKIKLSAAGKAKVTAKVNSSKKSIKLTGKAATKSTNVVITFKNNKTKKLTKVTTKAVVKEAEKPDEAYKINSATATGVKTITVELNKAVANAPSLSAIVKKGAATRDSKFAVDGSKIVITMDTKLMAGTYNVTIDGLEATALTADVAVEKDETLTSYEISENLSMASDTATDSAICYYSALNQYGEPMVADEPNVSTSFSSKVSIERVATDSVKGKILVKEIPTILAIQGTKGTVVLVDKNNGVTTTKEVVISAAATAAEATVVGTYNTASSAMEDLRAGANLGNYYILLTVKDQYGDPVSADDFAKVASISLAGGLTKVELANDTASSYLTSIVVDKTEYVAIKLKSATAVAGTYTMTVVNSKRGLLSSGTYDVIDSVVVNSVSITPKNGVYLGQDNEMDYSIIDKDGKEITSYAVLRNAVKFINASSIMTWERNADGTGKLVYHPQVTISGTSDTASTIDTITVGANEQTSSNYIVKTFTFTVNKARKIKTVQGLADGTATSVAKGSELKIAFDKIVYADQYSNKVTKDDTEIYSKNVTSAAIAGNVTGCSVAIVPVDNAFATSATVGATDLVFQSETAGTANVYLKYSDGSKAASTTVKASADNYDYKFIVTATDTGSVAATSLKINSINDGYALNVSGSAAQKLTVDMIEVVGTIGGSQTKIPASQYVIKETKDDTITEAEKNSGTKTKTATVVVQVTTWDSNNNATETELTGKYQVSIEDPKVFKVTEANATDFAAPTTAGAVTASGLQAGFKFRDQYNTGDADMVLTGKVATNVTYDVTVTKAPANDAYRVSGNNTNGVSVNFQQAGSYTIKVTATVNGTSKTFTKSFTIS